MVYLTNSKDEKIKKFHLQRQMFAIINNQVYIAPKKVVWSHIDWFEKLGFKVDEKFLNTFPRGYSNKSGMYFYKGYNHDFDENCEKIVLEKLEELIKKLDISINKHLFGGVIKANKSEIWPPDKDYGLIKNLIHR